MLQKEDFKKNTFETVSATVQEVLCAKFNIGLYIFCVLMLFLCIFNSATALKDQLVINTACGFFFVCGLILIGAAWWREQKIYILEDQALIFIQYNYVLIWKVQRKNMIYEKQLFQNIRPANPQNHGVQMFELHFKKQQNKTKYLSLEENIAQAIAEKYQVAIRGNN